MEGCVYAMHLMEISQRSSSILMVFKAKKHGIPFWKKGLRPAFDHAGLSFENFGQLSHVTVRSMSALSAMPIIHEDIIKSVKWKRVAMIIIPFRKQRRVDGVLEPTHTDFRCINQRVLQHAPCSVGILADRGLGGGTHESASCVFSSVTVFFFGGRDDREALIYGVRMTEHPGIILRVIRFFLELKPIQETVVIDLNNDLKLSGMVDENVLSEVQEKILKDGSVVYEERSVNDLAEIVAIIQEYSNCSLFVVGRRPEGEVAAVLIKRGECGKIGAVGNLLTSTDFFTTSSVLIVQQYYSQESSDLLDHSLKKGYLRDTRNQIKADSHSQAGFQFLRMLRQISKGRSLACAIVSRTIQALFT